MASGESVDGIVLSSITKQFDAFTAVDDVSFGIREGEFFSMLGPSGCGKTTTLRMIAGFEEPTTGTITLQGADVTRVPPARRNVNMVFQAYALFPHMNVEENVAFGLQIKKVPKKEIAQRVEEALASVRMEGFAQRKPGMMSGGQQQRVALARALVNRPAALLLDEPLGALDLKLRKEMQLELKHIQTQTGTTFVYVTHDQEEALTMSDRIAVMNRGIVEQIATPQELYERPATAFVAGFIGVSNILHLKDGRREGGLAIMDLGGGERIVAVSPGGGTDLELTVRPEKIKIVTDMSDDPPGSRVSGVVADVVYLGSMTEIIVNLRTGERLVVQRLNDEVGHEVAPGDPIVLRFAPEHAFVLGGGSSTHGAEEAPATGDDTRRGS